MFSGGSSLRTDSVCKAIGALPRLFEPQTSTRSELFTIFGSVFAKNYKQIVSIRVKAVSNTSLVAQRQGKKKNALRPVAVHDQRTPLLKLSDCSVSVTE